MSFPYKVSIIYTSSYNLEENKKTLKMLLKQFGSMDKLQVILVDIAQDDNISKEIEKVKKQHESDTIIIKKPDCSVAEAYAEGMKHIKGKWMTCIDAGDEFEKNYCIKMYSYLEEKHVNVNIAVANKEIFDGVAKIFEPYSNLLERNQIIDLDISPKNIPMCFNGTFIKSELLEKHKLNLDLNYDAETKFFYELILENDKIAGLGKQKYFCNTARDYMYRRFLGVYDREWYYDAIDKFMIPFLEEIKKEKKKIPVVIQYLALEFIMCRLEANMDNRNKHVLSEEEGYAYMENVRKILAYIEDRCILNMHEVAYYTNNPSDMRMLLQVKYNDFDINFNYYFKKRELNIAYNEVTFFSINRLRMNIMFMEYENGKLEIDASYPDYFPPRDVEVYVSVGGKDYELQEEEDYSITKYFGNSAYKRQKVHVSIPIKEDLKYQILQFKMKYKDEIYLIAPEYKSHTSRLSGKLAGAYWKFDNFIAYHDRNQIVIRRATKKIIFKRELSILKELLAYHCLYYCKVLALRELYWITRPFYKNKKIWMFYDKIYKGGDSSEYIYKYSEEKKDGVKKYYLLDKSACDYKRLKREGYKPLKRGTLKHKLVFMNADMVIASNSTVFAFNDFPMGLSAYFRGIFDFHVACVQHGMSVQKIAIAQKRLRDNTRLYFCASKYEIENLSKPVYNYVGYDALRLTGVPRYDGLIDEAEKQIMIAPTWRMQSAVLVTKNEGVQRDYNENFKETAYFRVFNSLINSPRLIEAAQKYGYRIKYVLHPIVSPQVDDFDKNDYVDIISAIGDMSYEELFRKSSLMVTDFSGIQFDFAYMRKPLVYLHHDDIPQHYEEGTYHYDTMAFGEICHNNNELIDLLCEYMQNDCVMKDEYKRRADDFFEFSDHNNCQRIYDEMIKYQTEKINVLKGRTSK